MADVEQELVIGHGSYVGIHADGSVVHVVSEGGVEISREESPPGTFRWGTNVTLNCRVYWGSHGCSLERGHDGPCADDCCACGEHHPFPEWPSEDVKCVALPPYYGPDTRFYGEDVETRGLPLLTA